MKVQFVRIALLTLFSIINTNGVSLSSVAFAQSQSTARIRLSRETTFLKGPVRKDGFVDYAAAMNTKLSEGVTSKNNAAALLAEVFGPMIFSENTRTEIFRRLGVPVPAKKATVFLSMSRFASRGRGRQQAATFATRLYEEQRIGSSRPWSRKELPRLAAWLDYNEKSLVRVHQAILRRKWYCPIVLSKDGPESVLIATLLELQQETRSLTRALVARALLAVQEDRLDDAQRDLLTGHRLARHVGHGFSLIESLIAYATDSMICQTEIIMLSSGKLSQDQLAKYAAELDKLDPLPSVAEKINYGERLTALDSVRYVHQNRAKGLKAISDLTQNSGREVLMLLSRHMDIVDWNLVMTMLNEEYDDTVAAARKTSFTDRKQAAAKGMTRIKEMQQSVRDPKTLDAITKGGKVDRIKLSELMGRVMITLLLPATRAARQAEDRAVMRFTQTRIAVALESFRKTTGRFPAKLGDLQPRFLSRIPDDLFSGRALKYRPGKNGYVLYSVGADRRDNGGRTFDSTPSGDDITVRVMIKR